MDEFSYHDIFATKGIEYLVIIAFLVLLIPFWVALNRQAKTTRQIQKALGALSASMLRIPQGLFYSGNHLWMHMEKSGTARLGMDDLLLHLTGKVNFKCLRDSGDIISKGDLLAELDQNGKTLQLFSPVSGQILQTNRELKTGDGSWHDDPYGKGWMYKIKPVNWVAEIQSCHFAEEAVGFSKNDLDRFKDFLARTMPDYSPESAQIMLQEGGEIMDHTLSVLPGETWQEFQQEFLNPDRL